MTHHPIARVLAGLAIVAACAWPASPAVLAQSARSVAPPRDLRAVLDTGYILQDRNGDGVVDFVAGRILVRDSPSEAELATAANIAARLAYETSAIDLGLMDMGRRAGGDSPVLVVGGVAPAGLAPGEGAVSFLPADGSHRRGGLAVHGYDASGLLAAGDYFAGRFPAVWRTGGPEWRKVAETLEAFLKARDVAPDALTLDRVVVNARQPGVSRVLATVRVADRASFERAVAELEGADTAAADTAGREPAGADPGLTARPQGKRLELADLEFRDLHRIDVRVDDGAGGVRTIRLLPRNPWATEAGRRFSAASPPDFTLSDLYTIRGLYRDTNQDLVPDRTDAYISLDGPPAAPKALVDLTSRVGLETAGMRLPFVRVGGQDDHPERAGFPILYGVHHYQTERLRDEDRLHTATGAPGEGFVEFVEDAFGEERHGLVIGGTDERGLEAVAGYMARRLPYLWEHGKGNYGLSDVEREVGMFLGAGGTAGKAALALHKLEIWLDRLAKEGITPDSLDVELTIKDRADGLERYLEDRLRARFPDAATAATVHRTGFGVGDTIFVQEVDFDWEVDEFRGLFRAEALPALAGARRGRIELRLSEPPEIRAALEREIRDSLAARGADPDAFDIVVLSAYKQGYSWLYDQILPRLRGRDIGRIEIGYHHLRDSEEIRWQTIASETRWLQEIFPIDAVLARELAIPDSLVVFSPARRRNPVYTVRVLDPGGREILTDTFDPRYVVRPFFDLFPEFEQVRVTTGWVIIEADGDTLLDRRIRTDPERFWDFLQTETYAKIIEYVMDVQEGRPSSDNAPYFDEFRVDLRLSEPNYRIGIDEEVISSLEALHSDIYYETVTLFSLIGARYGAGGLAGPGGRVLPWIEPDGAGEAGRARIVLTGKKIVRPEELRLTYRTGRAEPDQQRYSLSPLPVDGIKLRGIAVKAGDDGLARLLFEAAVKDSVDRYEEYRERASEATIDRTFLSAEMLTGMLAQLERLHRAGILEDALSLDRVAELAFRFVVEREGDEGKRFDRFAVLPRGESPRSTRLPRLHADGWRWGGEQLVQWETPIPPAENDSILARLATFPTVNVYYAGESFLGQNLFVAELLPPHEAEYVSQAKRNALRPTLYLQGRYHGNEVSSTSHILRLAELLATDTSYTELLERANVVLYPMANPDGARLAYEMQKVTPDFNLHAGYSSATGGGNAKPDAIYAGPNIMATWLPDVFVDMHGYPSHEWVQYFAGYSALVGSRSPGARRWWAPRGWFINGFSWVDDPKHPEYRKAQFAALDSITASINALPDVRAMNERQYARYAKYGRQDRENFQEHFHNGVLAYMNLRGASSIGSGVPSPRITYVSLATEVPDETARGDWLQLVASAGLAHSSALLRYLANGQNRIERETEEYEDFVVRSVFRRKPVLPPSEPEKEVAEGERVQEVPRSRERAPSARADAAPPKRWAVTVDLGFTGSSGNSELVALSTGVRVRHVQTTRFRLDWSAAFRYGESKGVVAARHAQSKLDFDLGPSARAAPFISATAQRDPFRRLELRSNFGAGFRYSFYRSQRSEASVRAAALYSHERFTVDVARPAHTDGAWSLKLNGAQRLGNNIRIESAASVEPVIGDFGDYNVETTSKLSTHITPRVALTFNYSYSYDSTPVSKVEHADHRLQSGLSMAF